MADCDIRELERADDPRALLANYHGSRDGGGKMTEPWYMVDSTDTVIYLHVGADVTSWSQDVVCISASADVGAILEEDEDIQRRNKRVSHRKECQQHFKRPPKRAGRGKAPCMKWGRQRTR